MARTRRVEEYRGFCIVTDGANFGVEWPLGNECRYLDPAGARAAIDSELAAARHQREAPLSFTYLRRRSRL